MIDSIAIDPATLVIQGYGEYPTPPPMPQEVTPTEPSNKKKRKAWGQPVPEIKQILPPRKRAKTAEEKEQRKNERILRNRRAADKSRQRQKLAVADLEAKSTRMEQEMAALRAALTGYQERFGVQKDLEFDFSVSTLPSDLQSAPSPLNLDEDDDDDDDDADTPATSLSYATPAPQDYPILVQTDSCVAVKHESPVLSPSLDIKNKVKSEETSQPGLGNSTSVLTQYPAAVLCDLQCQTECGATNLSVVPFQLGLSSLLQWICWMTFQTFSTSTLSPMYQIFQLLEQKLAMNSVEQTLNSLIHNFPTIHSLISMPSTSTRPAVFRMKLLSRLLACSPLMARLLLAATDRALQQVVSDDGFVQDPDRRWSWASLMTIKWGILKLEREHRKIRRSTESDYGSLRQELMAGVDLGAVARNSELWKPRNCINREQSWTTAPEVH